MVKNLVACVERNNKYQWALKKVNCPIYFLVGNDIQTATQIIKIFRKIENTK